MSKVKRYGKGIPRTRKPSKFQTAVFTVLLAAWLVSVAVAAYVRQNDLVLFWP